MTELSQESELISIHREFVAEIKAAALALQGVSHDPSTVQPTIVGAKPLDFRMPPMMEEAFGYGGILRFVEFSYNPLTRRFGYSDGGDHVVSDEQLWQLFVNHPLITFDLGEDRYPTLYGKFSRERQGHSQRLGSADGRRSVEGHCLLLDRQSRQPYVCTREQMILFFPLTEPEDGDNHTIVEDGLLLSPGSRVGKDAPSFEFRERFLTWLDNEVLGEGV